MPGAGSRGARGRGLAAAAVRRVDFDVAAKKPLVVEVLRALNKFAQPNECDPPPPSRHPSMRAEATPPTDPCPSPAAKCFAMHK